MKLHTVASFYKYGFKQPMTWIGILLLCWFIYNFYYDVINLIHQILRSPGLIIKIVETIGSLIGGIAGVIIDRFKNNTNAAKPTFK